jgi:hypothetical protein
VRDKQHKKENKMLRVRKDVKRSEEDIKKSIEARLEPGEGREEKKEVLNSSREETIGTGEDLNRSEEEAKGS